MRRHSGGGSPWPLVLLIAGRALAADGEQAGTLVGTGSTSSGEAAVSAAMAADVRSHLLTERTSASRGVWGWSIVGVGAGVYAGLALAGSADGGPATQSVAWVATIAGLVGVTRAVMREREVAKLERHLATDMDRAAAFPTVTLAPETRSGIDRELRGRLTALRSSARGALRAGCVLPVLLAGIGAYGVSSGGSGGDALAGLGLGGALVIGAPSVISYVGLQGRLVRMEDLVARWDRALAGGR